MRYFFLFVIFVLFQAGFSSPFNPALQKSKPEFNRNSMLRDPSSSSFISSSQRFSMSQSYTTSMSMSNAGSQTSGLYVNHMAYQVSNPLSLFLDLGFYSPFQSTGAYQQYKQTSQTPYGSFVIPAMGLQYQPTENFSLSIIFSNMQTRPYSLGSSYFGR